MADEPSPKADRRRTCRSDATLSWKAGPYAATHNVYLGTTFADVNTADATKRGQRGPDRDDLQAGHAVWNTARPTTGAWTKSTPRRAPRSSRATCGASRSSPMPIRSRASRPPPPATTRPRPGPPNTINGSGLTGDLHGTAIDTMWNSSMTGPTPVWIQYQFDKAYKLSELWVWNSQHRVRARPRLRDQGRHHRVLPRRQDLDAAEGHAVRPGARRRRVRPQHHRRFRRRHGPVRQDHGQEQLEHGGPQAVRPERSPLLLRPGAGPRPAAGRRTPPASA